MTSSDASKVVCTGDGLLFGYINHPIRANIDTSGAGPGAVEEGFAQSYFLNIFSIAGELKVFCEGVETKAICELEEQADGTFLLLLKPREIGVHHLHVQYDDVEVPGTCCFQSLKLSNYT